MLAKGYEELARRYLDAAEALLGSKADETAGFLAYHAYESIASAWISHCDKPVPTSHPKKLNAFLSLANRNPLNQARGVFVVNKIFEGLRDSFLYPIEDLSNRGTYFLPKDRMNTSQVGDLVERAKGIINLISPLL